MGLDMYLYKAKKISEEQKKALVGLVKNDAETDERFENVVFFDKDVEDVLLKDITDFCDEIVMKGQYVDMQKLKTDFNIPEDAYESGFGFNSENMTYAYSFRNQDNSYHDEVVVPCDEFEEKYVFEEDTSYLVCYLEEIDYWRKEYPLRRTIHDLIPVEVENCGYYRLDEKALECINAYNEGHDYEVCDYSCNADEAIFYHEWY